MTTTKTSPVAEQSVDGNSTIAPLEEPKLDKQT